MTFMFLCRYWDKAYVHKLFASCLSQHLFIYCIYSVGCNWRYVTWTFQVCLHCQQRFYLPIFFSLWFVVLLLLFSGSVVEVTMCAIINLTRIILLFLVAPYYNWNTTVSGMYVHFNERHYLIVLYIFCNTFQIALYINASYLVLWGSVISPQIWGLKKNS